LGVEEKTLTLDVAQRVIDMINRNSFETGIKVYATRQSDSTVDLFDRAPFANEVGDLFVSVHINSAAPNTVPNGVETYFHPHDNDNYMGISTEEMAEIFHKNILDSLGAADRKIKENVYVVLVDTEIPSVLCELGFISNPDEGARLLDDGYRQAAAQAIYESILETFQVYTPMR
jgi:N-acetylmuramoyl-L-alanine amidase